MDQPRLLALETSWSTGSVALFTQGRLLSERSISEGMRHGRDLVPVVSELVDAAGLSPQDINAVAVSAGPGSFTGLRIAATVARMLAWQNSAATVAVPTLQAIAAQAAELARRGGNSEIVAVGDALRGGIYAARFAVPAEGVAGPPQYIATETVGPAEEIAEAIAEDSLITGDGLKRFAALFGRYVHAPADIWHPTAAMTGEIGLWMLKEGRGTDPAKLEPLYVRQPAPEEVWQRRQRGGR